MSIPSTDISVDRPSGDGSFGYTAFAVSREGSDKRFNRGMPGRHRPADKGNNKNNKPPFGYGGFLYASISDGFFDLRDAVPLKFVRSADLRVSLFYRRKFGRFGFGRFDRSDSC